VEVPCLEVSDNIYAVLQEKAVKRRVFLRSFVVMPSDPVDSVSIALLRHSVDREIVCLSEGPRPTRGPYYIEPMS
jgi:hypothetical protein